MEEFCAGWYNFADRVRSGAGDNDPIGYSDLGIHVGRVGLRNYSQRTTAIAPVSRANLRGKDVSRLFSYV